MIALLTLMIAIIVSLLIVRVATVALQLTGISQDLARFEARSAFTGAGFTTADSEKVVNHPVRRQIIMLLMLFGNAGIVTVISSAILSFTRLDGKHWWDTFSARVAILSVGLFFLWQLSHSQWIDAQLSRLIKWALRRFTRLDVHDFVGLLHLGKGYSVAQMYVDEGNWLAKKTLMQLRLSDEGVLVLGVERQSSGVYHGAPKGKTELFVGDTLLVYGPEDVLEELDRRRDTPEGQVQHQTAVEKQADQISEPYALDPSHPIREPHL